MIFNKKNIVFFVIFLILFLAITLLWEVYITSSESLKEKEFNEREMIDRRANSLLEEVQNFPRSAVDDILFLSKLSSITDTMNFSKDSKNQLTSISNAEVDFLNFLRQNSAYYIFKYIDHSRAEIVHVRFDKEGKHVVVSNKSLSDSETYYFNQIIKLDGDEVFISQLNLHRENGNVENRGTVNDPEYIPVIRYGVHVFDEAGVSNGIIMSTVYADYFLEDIRRAQRNGEMVTLLDNKGHYLSNVDRRKEFSFDLGKNKIFLNDYPDLPKDVLSDFDQRKRYETDDEIFSFWKINPTSGSFELYKGSEKLFGPNSQDDYYWVLVVVSNKYAIQNQLTEVPWDFIILVLFTILVLTLIILLLFVLYSKINRHEIR